MAAFYTVTWTEKEHKAMLEMLELYSLEHIKFLRETIGKVGFNRFDKAINKINNSKPVFIHK